MDVYPQELITHEAPLVVVSGLAARERHSEIPPYPLLKNGLHIPCDLPPITGDTAEHLADYFQKNDATGLWCQRGERGAKGPQPSVFRIRLVGREYQLPPRKANPPSPGAPSSPSEGPPTRVLHSPISPLSPDSPLFPDGAITHIWLRKHQSLLPAAFVAFFSLNTSTNDPSVQALEDNKIVEAINRSKQHFSTSSSGTLTSVSSIGSEELRSSGHRTKFVAVVLSERSIMTSAQVDDRLTSIRRGTGLTTNATFFVAQSNTSPVELEQFVQGLLATLWPGAVEYYRELSKHARRKRNKGSIPPPTIPSSRALSSQGWNLRYEFKLGVFAEFRQEMDGAGRNYETAYEKLLSEVFEATSSWTDRWTEARMLADILILRIIRCYLCVENYVAAKQRWSYHIARMRDVIDRKGKGTQTYGFAAWLSRWNKCLADLLHFANLPVFLVNLPPVRTPGHLEQEPPKIYFRPDKVGVSLTSHELLHHAGFYYLAAAEWTKVREKRAKRISADDRDTDTYLCPPPREEAEFDHAALQISYLGHARTEFSLRQQERMAESVSYRLAVLRMVKATENSNLWIEALKDLRTIASRYRKEGWWILLEDVLWRIIECGRGSGDAGSVVLAEFELMCRSVFAEKPGKRYDLDKCLEGIDTLNVKPTIVARASDVVNILSVCYSFEFPTVHAGQAVNSQLSIASNAHPSAAPLVFSEVKITYEGGLKTVLLRHKAASTSEQTQRVRIANLHSALHEYSEFADAPLLSPTSIASHTYMVAETDLSIAPGKVKVFELSAILREAGSAKAICGTFGIVNDSFDLDFVVMFCEDDIPAAVHPLPTKNVFTTPNGGTSVWWKETADGKTIKRPIRTAPDLLTILPRPPKMEVSAKGLEYGVYTDETVKIGLEVLNGEDEDADVSVDVKIIGWPMEEGPVIAWLADDGSHLEPTASLHSLGNMKPNQHITRYFTFPSAPEPADCTLEVKLRYNLVSDPETPTEKTVMVDMSVVSPFHCTFDFSPRVRHDTWPDYFSLDNELFASGAVKESVKPQGIMQRWCLTATVQSVGKDDITIEGWELHLQQVAGAAGCDISLENQKAITLEPSKTVKIPFNLDISKHGLEDRSPSTLDTTLHLHWRRTSSATAPLTTTPLLVPRLFVPLREPRVLAESHPSRIVPGALNLTYTIENPTNYFLTFALLMETNDSFAFSGPKQTGLQLLPLSREKIEYTLLPYTRDTWVRPSLKVVDRYFNKTLKTLPAGDGCAAEKGVLVVRVPKELLLDPEGAGEEEDRDSDEDSDDDSDFEPSESSEDSLEYAEDSDEDETEGEEEGEMGKEDKEDAKKEENTGDGDE